MQDIYLAWEWLWPLLHSTLHYEVIGRDATQRVDLDHQRKNGTGFECLDSAPFCPIRTPFPKLKEMVGIPHLITNRPLDLRKTAD